MKKNVYLIFLCFPFLLSAITIYQGPELLDAPAWNTASNWSSGVPGVNEEVRFNTTVFITRNIPMTADNDIVILGNGSLTILSGVNITGGNVRINGSNGMLRNHGTATFLDISYSLIVPFTSGGMVYNTGTMFIDKLNMGSGNTYVGGLMNEGFLYIANEAVIEEGTFTNDSTGLVFFQKLIIQEGAMVHNQGVIASEGPFQSANIAINNGGLLMNGCYGTVISEISGDPGNGGGVGYAIEIAGTFDNYGGVQIGYEFPMVPELGSKGILVGSGGSFFSSGDCAHFEFNIDEGNCVILDNHGPGGSFLVDDAVGEIHSGTNCTGLLLPVTLLSFTGKSANGNVLLSWLSGEETNALDYEVQTSFDGKEFRSLDHVPAKGPDSQYHFISKQEESTIYFRLKMNDLDGKFAFSKTLFIPFSDDNLSLRLWPNLIQAGEKTTLYFAEEVNAKSTIFIYESSGRIVKQLSLSDATLRSYDLDTHGFHPGLYQVQFHVQGKQLSSVPLLVR